ncbi:SH3 domain-containing protein [Pseudonocardia sp. ICBG1293]|uniref:SH3 domain-containing protein n=1 Tax=Pseudonocardia sp. ICBG1293 TaxID=2844382 RepID=UPI001CCA881F|nr:SH3 domain-containing protein [Pseudonocardia sp. ICBG1293]
MKPNSRRVAAGVGALAVAGVTTTWIIAGTASAAGTGTCTESVNVRSEPEADAPIVGVCERGETTSTGETQDGFVELPEYGGWAMTRYVSTSGSERSRSSEDSLTPSSSERSAPSTDSPSSSSPSSSSPRSGSSSAPSTSSPRTSSSATPSSDEESGEGSDSSSEEARPTRSSFFDED